MDRSSWIRWIVVGTVGALVLFLALKKMRDVMPHMMAKMMQQCMASGDTMHETMPKMMETCLGAMSGDERKRMLTFCQTMLKEMEEKYT